MCSSVAYYYIYLGDTVLYSVFMSVFRPYFHTKYRYTAAQFAYKQSRRSPAAAKVQ